MNVFAKFDEISSMILQDIKETKCYGHKNVSDTRSFGQRENSIPSHKQSLRGYNYYQNQATCNIFFFRFVQFIYLFVGGD